MRIGIVGAGAAGMMAAAAIAEKGGQNEAFLIDKNDNLGRKVLLSGGGRCNITTSISDIKQILQNYPRGKNFLKFAMHNLPPQKLCEWLSGHGLGIKEEAHNKIFPRSDTGIDVIMVFEKIFKKAHVHIALANPVLSIEKTADKFTLTLQKGPPLEVDKLIITTGGRAHRETGSTGNGYTFAEKFGHTIMSLSPSLHAYELGEFWPKSLSGLSFANAKLKFAGTKSYEFSGPFIFTHKGISGPAVFALSSLAAYETIGLSKPPIIHIDFLPDKTYEVLTKEISSALSESTIKTIVNTISRFIPRSLAETFLNNLVIPQQKKNAEISKKELNKIVELIKNSQLTVTNRVSGEEFVTAGGVTLSEVNPKTMESKICKNLYFAGEVLDIDGFTGGFNLQSAWCTGFLAGESATK